MPRAKKSPAFQWYPRDYLADALVISMTLEQEGAYNRLLNVCWLEHGLPTDIDKLWRLAKARSRDHFEQRIWTVVGHKFQLKKGKFQHKRLDRERAKQAKNRRQKQLAAQKRWEHEQSNRNADASSPQCLSSASSSAAAANKDQNLPPHKPRRSARAQVFDGIRLKVSKSQHDVVCDELGTAAGHIDLLVCYERWDRELIASGEEFDTLSYIKRRATEAAKALRRGGPLYAVSDDGEDWFEECQRLHGRSCNGRHGHALKMEIDAAKAAAS